MKLHVYRDTLNELVLAVYAEDPDEYSAIYIIEDEHYIKVASNLADINHEEWGKLEWHHALLGLLAQPEVEVVLHDEDTLPPSLLALFDRWWMEGAV